MSRSTDSRVALHLPLVRIIALQVMRKLPRTFELEDLVSIGAIGLLGAARKYRATSKVPFPVFAGGRIRAAIVGAVRKEYHWAAGRLPLSPSRPAAVEEAEPQGEDLGIALDSLTERQREIIRMVYWEGRSLRNVSRSTKAAVMPANVVNILTGRGVGFGGARGGWRAVEREHLQALAQLRFCLLSGHRKAA